jgi:uncharacterized protein Usg
MANLIINPASRGLYRLTLAEITYYLPDYEDLLQSYLWQEYDYLPEFPHLKSFLDFWQKEIEGKIHSVKVATQLELKRAEFYYVKGLEPMSSRQ